MLFAVDFVNFKKFFLKILRLGAFWISGSCLFHLMITDGRKVFLNILCLTLKWGMLYALLVEYGLINLGIILKSYFGDWFFKIFKRQQNFLYHRLCCRDSKSSSSKSLYLDVPRIAPVMITAALDWMLSIFCWKDALHAWPQIISP